MGFTKGDPVKAVKLLKVKSDYDIVGNFAVDLFKAVGGDATQAEDFAKRASELDPLDPKIGFKTIQALKSAGGDIDQAIQKLRPELEAGDAPEEKTCIDSGCNEDFCTSEVGKTACNYKSACARCVVKQVDYCKDSCDELHKLKIVLQNGDTRDTWQRNLDACNTACGKKTDG